MVKNVVLVGLCYNFVGNVANTLAEKTGKFFLDVNKLIEYSLIDIERAKLICGLDYIQKEQSKIIKSLKNYENTIINLPYDFLLNNEFDDVFKDSYIIFINLSKDVLLNINKGLEDNFNLNVDLMVFDEICKLITGRANLTINSSENIENCVKELQKNLEQVNF